MNEKIVFEIGCYERTFLSRLKRIMNFKTDEQALVFSIQYMGQRLNIIKREQRKRRVFNELVSINAEKLEKNAKTENNCATGQRKGASDGSSLSCSAEKKGVEKQRGRLLADFI
jgi:hypothetical protein